MMRYPFLHPHRLRQRINTFGAVFVGTLILLGIVFQSAEAVFNKQINYQGKLTTSVGVAVPNGTYNMEFKLYTVSSGGTAVWTEQRVSTDKVQVTSGLFSVLLGEVTSLSGVDFNQTLYLGVNIGGTGSPSWDGEMTPRKKLGAVPAAVESERVGGFTPSQTPTGSQIPVLSSGELNMAGAITSGGLTVNTAAGGVNDDKLAITVAAGGAAQFTGTLTNADITGSNKTWTLPNTTGTIALTSDLTTGYVPYTGANTNVNLGANSLTATGITNSSMTSGSILFAGASGLMSQDNTNFFYDNSLDSLGIGTNTPTSFGDRIALLKSEVASTHNGHSTMFLRDNSTYNTTAATKLNYAAIISNQSTISSGANALTNVGLYANASGGTNNYALQVGAGNVKIDPFTAANGVVYATSAGILTQTAASSGASCLISASAGAAPTWGTCGTGGIRWDQITAPTADLTLAHGAFKTNFSFNSVTTGSAFTLSSSSLTTGSILDLTATGTTALTNQKGLNISLSGANGTGAQTTYGAYLSNTHTGTSNNVGLYATATGGTNNYAAIFENGNVGIGTTTPGYKLEVAGTVAVQNSDNTHKLYITSPDAATWNFDNTSVGTFLQSKTSNRVYAYQAWGWGSPASLTTSDQIVIRGRGNTSASQGLRITDNSNNPTFIVRDDGNVGIGTASPAGLLSLSGNKTAAAWGTAGINFQTAAATYTDNSSSGTVATNVANSLGVPTLASSSATTYTNASTLYIAGAPSAGTNATLTNAWALNVNGATRIQTTTTKGLTLTSTGGSDWRFGNVATNSFGLFAPVYTGASVALLNFTDYTDTSVPSLNFLGGIQAYGYRHFWGINTSAVNYSTDFVVKSFGATHVTGVSNSSDVMTQWVNSDGGAYFAGNVGIGDASPASLLTVGSGDLFQVNSSGAIAAATGITTSGTVTLSTAPTTSAGGYDILTRNTSTGVLEKIVSTAMPGGSGTTDYIARWTGTNTLGTGVMRDDGTYVGIGTAPSASYKLDVNGNTNISGRLNFTNSNNSTQILISANGSGVGGSSTSGELIAIGRLAANGLNSSGGANLVAIGINAGLDLTTGGSGSIHIGRGSGRGITTGTFNTQIGMTDTSNIPSGTAGTIHIIAGGGYESNNALATLPGATSKYAFIGGGYNSSGYINDFYFGAGAFVTSPSTANLSIYAPSGNGTDLVGSNFTLNAGRGTGTGTSGDFIIQTANTTTTGATVQTLAERLRIKGVTGNVGIGTASPGAKLDVLTTPTTAYGTLFTSNFALSTNSTFYGQNITTNVTTSAGAGGNVVGQQSTVGYAATANHITGIIGYQVDTNFTGTGTLSVVNGMVSQGYVGNGATVTAYYGFKNVGLFTPGTGAVIKQYGYYYDQTYITPTTGYAFYSKVNPSGGTLASYTGTAISIIPGNSIVQIGGQTSSFPALKRSGAILEVKLADDSAYATTYMEEARIRGAVYFYDGGGNYSRIYGTGGDGVIRMTNNGASDFNRLQFGGTTSSFPAIKRNGAGIDFRLADDSAYTSFTALGGTLTSFTAANGVVYSTSAGILTQTAASSGASCLISASAGAAPTWGSCGGAGGIRLDQITAANTINTIDSLNFAQTWNWSTASTENPLTINANAITTGSILSLLSSSTANTGTNGLLYVANTSATTTGTIARIQSNSTAGSGLTVLGSGRVGIGTTAPTSRLVVSGGGTPGSMNANTVLHILNDGTSGSYTALSIEGGSAGGSFIDFNDELGAGRGQLIYDHTTDSMQFGVNAGERMRIESNGDVGIGDTTPASLFTVGSGDLFQVNSSGAIAAATGIASSGTINFSGLTASSAVYTDGSKNLTSTAPTSGAIGYWSRSGTTLSTTTAGDSVSLGLGLILGGTPTAGDDVNVIYGNSSNTTLGFVAGASRVAHSSTGPAFVARGNTYSAIANQRGSMYFLAGDPSSPTSGEGILAFYTGATIQRLLIEKTGEITQTYAGTTLTGYTLNANSLTSGKGLSVASSAAANFTGSLANIELSAGTGASSNTGSLLTLTNSGTSNANTALIINHYATGGNNLAFRVNDVSGDTTPFIIDGTGNVGIGTTSASSALTVVGSTSFTGSAGNQFTFLNSTATNSAGAFRVAVTSNSNFIPSAVFTTTQTATGSLNASYGLENFWTSAAVVTGSSVGQTAYGIYNLASKAGADTATGTYNLYASYNAADNTGRTDVGTVNTYGGYFSALGDTAGTSTAIGAYFDASGSDNNYAAIFAAGNVGIGDTTPASLFTVGSGDLFQVNTFGDVFGNQTTLDGSTTSNGSGTNSTSLIVTSATNFNIGNYVKVDPTGSNTCSGVVTVCYAKITNISGTTFTISPALDWDSGASVVEVHIPEVGGVNLTQGLANRYGRGYFIDGIVTGNGSTYFSDSSINSTLGSLNINAVSGVSLSHNDTIQLRVTEFGVAIGNTSPAEKLLEVGNNGMIANTIALFVNVDGNCSIDVSDGRLSCSSDQRLKKNITTLNESGLEGILGLRPVTYNWNREADGITPHIGFIAQEVEQIFPDLVSTNPTTGLKSLSMASFVPHVVSAIQEMDLKIVGISDTAKPNTWRDSLLAWFGNVGNGIENLYAKVIRSDRVETKTLCVGSTCVTEEQFLQMVQGSGTANSNGGSSGGDGNQPPASEPDPTGGDTGSEGGEAGGELSGSTGEDEGGDSPTPSE